MRLRELGGIWAMAALAAGCVGPGESGGGGGAGPSGGIFELPVHRRDLANGLRVFVVPTGYPDVVTIQIAVHTGSRNEVEPGKSGFAHFFEHMMFRGTERYPAEVYGEILKNAGADQNAYTSDDYTNYHITFTREDLETVIRLEADRFENLAYSEEQFRTEALAVKGEYLKNFSDPSSKLFEHLRELAYDGHPYQHTTMGFLRDIEAMPDQIEYSREFFRRWYRPEKTTIILAGDLDPEETLDLVEKHWSGWERGSWELAVDDPAPLKGPVRDHIRWPSPTQPLLTFAFRGPRFEAGSKEMPAMDLAGQLWFSRSSDLYQKLVVEDRSVDRLSWYFPDQEDPGLLVLDLRLNREEAAGEVARAVLETIARARTERVEVRKLEDVKSRLRYRFASGLDNSESIGAVLATYARFDRDPAATINRLYGTYASIDADDLRELTSRFFRDERMVLLSLSAGDSIGGLDGLPSIESLVAARSDSSSPSASPARIVEVPSAASPLVDVSLLFATGAADDPRGKKGLAALTAALIVDGGTRRRTIREIRQLRFPWAAGFGAQVDKEMTRLAGSVHRDNLEAWTSLALEQLLEPGWREEDLERVRTRLVNSIRTDLRGNNDEELGKEALYAFLYGPEHPYGSLDQGAVRDLESITIDEVKAFYRDHFTRASLTVGLAGGYPEGFRERILDRLDALEAGTRAERNLPPPPPIEGREALVVEKDAPAVAVSFGFPIAVRRGDPDWVALWLARSWLGEHRSSNSRLYQRIREVRGMNYGDYAYIEYFPRGMYQFHPDANLGRRQQIFQVWLRPLRDNQDACFATRVALYELEKLVRDGMSEEDFETTRNYLRKFVSLLVKSQSRQLGYALDSRYYGTKRFAEYVREGLDALDVAEVNRVIRKHLQLDRVKFVFVAKEAEDLRKRLVEDTPSPMRYNSEKPAELLAEDKVIEGRPFGFRAVKIVPVRELFEASGGR